MLESQLLSVWDCVSGEVPQPKFLVFVQSSQFRVEGHVTTSRVLILNLGPSLIFLTQYYHVCGKFSRIMSRIRRLAQFQPNRNLDSISISSQAFALPEDFSKGIEDHHSMHYNEIVDLEGSG